MKPAHSSSDLRDTVAAQLVESAAFLTRAAREDAGTIVQIAGVISECYRRGGTLLICGNGGSAADAQHAAGELVGRFLMERRPLSCIALTTDSSVMTAIGNDYGFENVFARQVQAHGHKGDLLCAISTSGNSPNILKAVEEARQIGMGVVALSGRDGGALARLADLCVTVAAKTSPRIQEVHGAILHVICALVEKTLFPAARD
ncbi:MAG: D-sedoheptulose 7-phosphate isomerase [Candidatus Aureabacteria bacterium]|nr:D-sedoheptulose 7-phosphate isomerase [Candidatus Auribacterota bacterium]